MHADIAATVAREHTPGLSAAAIARLEELLQRSPTLLELEVYAALLGAGSAAGDWPLQVELASGTVATVAVASGPGAVGDSALGLAAAGARPLAMVLGQSATAAAEPLAAAERLAATRLGFSVVAVATGPAAAVTGVAIGLAAGPGEERRALAAGDVLLYLGAPTGREGISGATSGGVCPPPSQATQDQTMALLQTLQARPGLVLWARVLGHGGLAQAAAELVLGVQILLDAVPRQPMLLHPKELLLAETVSRALVVVPAERVAEVLAEAQGQALVAAAIGVVTAEKRLDALMKPRGATVARPVCELPLLALHRESLPLPAPGPESAPRPVLPPPAGLLPADSLRLHLRRHAGPVPSPAVVLPQGALALAVRYLPATFTLANPDPSVGEARQALSAAVGAVRASRATPVAAAWLLTAAADPPAQRSAPGEVLSPAGADLGLTVVSARSAALPAGGLLVVLGEHPADVGSHFDRFPGPGFLVAVLGFDAGTPAQEQVAGALVSELVHAGLGAAVLPLTAGGLLVALARACANGGVGCTAVLPPPTERAGMGLDELVREVPGRYLLTIPAHRQADARILASERGVPLWPLGRTGGSELLVRRSDGPADNPFTEVLRLQVAELLTELLA